MSYVKLTLLSFVLAGCVSAAAMADPVKTKQELADAFPGLGIENINDGPIPGVYELSLGAQVAYVTDDGRYLIKGEIIDLETNLNVTETRRAQSRAQVLASLDEANMIIFSPKDPAKVRYTVTVLTDIDCGYCRKLHKNMAQMNDLGVRVRYLLYPRSGPGTPSWDKATRVWCSANRQSALTAAKNDQVFESSQCETAPVMAQYEIGQNLGMRGTPAILTEGGDYIGGYLSPGQLVEQLSQTTASHAGTQ